MNKRLMRGTLYTISSFIALILPNVVWFFINRKTYFQTGVEKISIGASLTLLFILALLRGAFKELDKRFSILISMLVALAIVWFFDSIIKDLFWIITCGIIGFIMYIGLSTIGRKDLAYYKEYSNEKARIEARNEAQSQLGGSV